MNLVVVICHDLGYHLGCYGIPKLRTPDLDRFAAEGLRFENSFCTAPQCSPSRAALWTGRYPHANGVVGLTHEPFANSLKPSEKALVNILNDAGYRTHLFGGQHAGISGFQKYHTQGWGTCGKNAADIKEFLNSYNTDDGPLYLQVGFSEPHRTASEKNGKKFYFQFEDGIEVMDPSTVWVPPYLPDDEPVIREDLAQFEASIYSVDKAFGVIVKAIKESEIVDNTIIVFTVDHGIPFPGAKMTLYDPGIETALLMQVPGIEGGKVYKELISNVDFVPTILDLLSIDIPENVQGRSFKGLLTAGAYRENEAIFAGKTYHSYYDPMRAVRTKKWKLITNFEAAPWQETPPDYWNNGRTYVEFAYAYDDRRWPGRRSGISGYYHPPMELYDLENDPWETRNLADISEYDSICNGLCKILYDWMERTGDPLLYGSMAQGAYIERIDAFKKRSEAGGCR